MKEGKGMTNVGSCKNCRYFDSRDWDCETKNWCRYKDLPAIDEGLCGYYEPMLKPCPFCGKDVELNHCKTDYNDWWYVACRNCSIAVDPLKLKGRQTLEDAIRKWNRRK